MDNEKTTKKTNKKIELTKEQMAAIAVIAILLILFVVFAVLYATSQQNANDLQSQITSTENTSSKKSTQIETLTTQIESKTAEIATLETQITQKETEIATLNNEITKSANNANTLSAQIAQLKQNVETLTTEKDTLNDELTDLQNELTTLNNTFSVVYVADNIVIHSENVAKGCAVTSVPDVPAKEHYNADWSNAGTNVTSNLTITAIYTPKTYTITYVLGRSSTNNGDYIYDISGDDKTVNFGGTTYTVDLSTNKVTYTEDSTPKEINIVDDKFELLDSSSTPRTFTVNRTFNIVYHVVGDNDAIAKDTFDTLPTTYTYGETIELNYVASTYIYDVRPDGTKAEDEEMNSRRACNWLIYGNCTSYVEYVFGAIDSSTLTIYGTGDIIVFVQYYPYYC